MRSISKLRKILKTYPKIKILIYAHYLIAMCYYETIEDEKRDLQSINKAKKFILLLKIIQIQILH